MRLRHGVHLAYCTNIHRGENWTQTLDALERYTLAVRERVCPDHPYAIGLRLGDAAARELLDRKTLLEFQRWLERHRCYVFTINGFPYGRFHGGRVKEQVYAPDWTTQERLDYTNRLFDILAQLVPAGVAGSVSTVPGSFKEFITAPAQEDAMRSRLWQCVEHIARVSERSGRTLHLGLEPEPLCYLETSAETVRFFEQLRNDRPGDDRLAAHLGVNYDTCHLAVEYEEPADVMRRFQDHGVKISKIHLSSALKVRPTAEVRRALRAFAEDVYFHQVIQRGPDGALRRFRDLDLALATPPEGEGVEWRIHFHIPLHHRPTELFETTVDHIEGLLPVLQSEPELCSHLEMETYTWEVMPAEMKNRQVVDQLASEYEWCLPRLAKHGFDRAAEPSSAPG